MTSAFSVKALSRTVLVAALLSGSSLAAAQEVPTVTAAPAPVAPVEVAPAPVAKVAPPPLVSTLPSKNDVVNPAALQEVEEERQAKVTPATVSRNRAPTKAPTRAPVVKSEATPVSEAPEPKFNEPTLSAAPAPPQSISETVAAPTSADGAPVTASADDGGNDLPLFAGIAAALAALGLGGLFVARRRRDVPAQVTRPVETSRVEPSPIAPTPVKPVMSPAIPLRQTEVRESVNTRPDVPVTDPLFSRTVVPAAITDPMFAPRNDVQTPITDPLFAGRQGFSGRVHDVKPSQAPEMVK